MSRVNRIDFAPTPLKKAETTPEGFLRLEGRVARTGIQLYKDGAGKVRRELRLPDDVRASLPGFALSPLTNDHPAQRVEPGNAREHVAGAVGDARLNADGWVVAPITIFAADTIAAVRAGKSQLSCGYSCEVVHEPGEWQGQRYDSRQTAIQINHVAIVDVARSGPEGRLRLDAADAIAIDETETEKENIMQGNEEKTDEIPELEKIRAERDALAGKLAALEAARVDTAQRDDADFRARVDARVELEMTASRFVSRPDIRGKSDAQVQRALLAKIAPPTLSLKDRSDSFVAAAIESLLPEAEARRRGTVAEMTAYDQHLRADASPADIWAPTPPGADPDEARRRYLARQDALRGRPTVDEDEDAAPDPEAARKRMIARQDANTASAKARAAMIEKLRATAAERAPAPKKKGGAR